MLTDREIYLGILLPGLVSAALMLFVVWRRWAAAVPAVAGVAIMVGYGLLRRPGMPPQDGSDWVFWMLLPLMGGGIAFNRLGAKAAGIGALAGAVVFVVLWPIRAAIGPGAVWQASAVAAVWGIAAALTLPWAAQRFGAVWVVGGLASIAGAAGVLVASSNYLAYGVCGMGAAMAIVPVALGLGWMERRGASECSARVRGLSISIVGFLAGLLAGGRYYPQTGVSPLNFHIFGAAPLCLAPAAFLPGKRKWAVGLVAFAGVSAVVWAVAIPKALAAKKALETPVLYTSSDRPIRNS